MKDKDIEQKIYQEFEDKKPELFNKIMEQCPKMNEPVEQESIFNKLRNLVTNKRFSYSFATVGLIIVMALIVTGIGGVEPLEPYSVIAIDVNPSLVLELDDEDTVINVIVNNEDAEIIIGDMDLIGVDYNVAINALIGSMVTNGYISDLTNSILLSISSGDTVRENELMIELSQKVSEVLEGQNINGSVITQNLEFEEDAEDLAELLEISEAKAELILDIIEVDPRMIVEELALLSINDLNLLLEAKNIVLEDVEKTGNASTLEIKSVEEVYQIALTELNLDEVDVVEVEIELEQEDGIMVYEVEIDTDTDEYELLIDAKEGTVYTNIPEDSDGDGENPEDPEFPTEALTESELLNIIAIELDINQAEITEFEYEEETENGIAFYSVSFEYNDEEYELEIDAITGEIYSNSMDEEGFDHEEETETDESDEEEEDV